MEASKLFQKLREAQNRLMAARSGEQALTWGRSLYQCLRAHGLVHVEMEGYVTLRTGGSAGAQLLRANFEQIQREAITAGLVTNEDVEHMFTLLDDPDFVVSAAVLFTAWGRRP
jgi:hypothetical protein